MSLTPAKVSADSGTPPKIDIYTDVDGDGIPDDLLSKFENLNSPQFGLGVKANADRQSAIKNFADSLPYSEQTRQLQRQAQLLQVKINNTKDPNTAARLLKQIGALQEKMMTDPAYAQTMAALEKIYVRNGDMPAPYDAAATDSNAFLSLKEMPRKITAETRTSQSIGEVGTKQSFTVYVGDIMLERGVWSPIQLAYTMTFSHAGVFAGNKQVYESNQDGVKLKSTSDWLVSGRYLGFGYNKAKWSQMPSVLTWAQGKYKYDGTTKYNYWFPNKWTDSRLYCSQLVWKINGHVGTNVDSNAWQYYLWLSARWGSWAIGAIAFPAVAPDELYYDSDLYFYAKGYYQ